MEKRVILFVSLLGSIILGLVFLVANKYGCDENILFFCRDDLSWLIYIIKIFPIILFFSLITYTMRFEVFKLWSKSLYIWLIVYVALVFFSPEYSNSFLPINERALASSVMQVLFIIGSVAIIVYNHFSS